MGTALAIMKRELRSYFFSPIAYIFIIIILGVTNFLFFLGFFEAGRATMEQFFAYLLFLFAICLPALTMKLFAEEKKVGTFEMLFTLPVNSTQAVAGKFCAALVILLLILFLTFPTLIIVAVFAASKLDWAVIIGSYFGALLLGAMILAMGVFTSSVTKEQVIALIVGITLCLLATVIGWSYVMYRLPVWLARAIQPFGLTYHFASIARGVIDFSDLLYFFSGTFIFLFLTVRVLDERKF
ncbi:MAG: ABC transporter permease [Planctomycetota bacterium]|jgi:ABC-2 type transport system permease protein